MHFSLNQSKIYQNIFNVFKTWGNMAQPPKFPPEISASDTQGKLSVTISNFLKSNQRQQFQWGKTTERQTQRKQREGQMGEGWRNKTEQQMHRRKE